MVKNVGIDKTLLITVTMLILFGLIMVYSSTMIIAKERFGDSFYFLKRQLLWLFLGLIIFSVIVSMKKPIFLKRNFVLFFLFISFAGLIMVFFSGKINNSFRWIRIAGLSVQPSEFTKISIVLYLAFVLSRNRSNVNDLKKLSVILAPVLFAEILILREPDFGTFALILIVTLVMLFVSGLRISYIFTSFFFLIPSFILIIKMNPEKMNRLLAFMNPEAYSTTYGFQTLQSVYGIGAGGIFGQGLGNSVQKLYFLPYAYSDFIFSVIGEEVGLIGTMLLLMLFLIFLARGLNIAKMSGNSYTYMLVIGLTFMVVFQAMINVSVTIGLFPTKGIPLPFISSGGSSLISSIIITGIILNISRHRKMVLLND